MAEVEGSNTDFFLLSSNLCMRSLGGHGRLASSARQAQIPKTVL
jgi:hypothetical protein